jgi:hypothetical protein
MPLYYFHVHGAQMDVPDLAGKDCPSLECAQKIAHRMAGELVMNALVNGRVPMDVTIEVEDEELRPVLCLPINESLIEVLPAAEAPEAPTVRPGPKLSA